MVHTLADSWAWMQQGTDILLSTLPTDDAEYESPTALPGWTRKHLVAHLAANADGLRNLVHWAATGEEAAMYSSPEQRAAEIEAGSCMSTGALNDWFRASAERLSAEMGDLTSAQWTSTVLTPRGRAVPATELPWLRAREVCVHAVDLGGVGFAALPAGFVAELIGEIAAHRSLSHLPEGPQEEIASWLSGRPHRLADVTDLGPWL
jgi:maleylpyruvate isomerase